MKIPISRNWFGTEELQAVQQPLLDGWLVQGRQVEAFERAFSAYVGAKHSLACSSGTAALQVAVASLTINPGDEVVVPGFTWVATANVVELLGGRPVFCDIDLSSFNVDIKQMAAAISERTVGLLPVHMFGWCAEMDEVLGLAANASLWVVEDAACALGAWYRGHHAGTIGDAGCFSFHPRKSITTGEGGMVTVRDDALRRRCAGLRNHGAVPAAENEQQRPGQASLLPSFSLAGFNYRLTDIQAALGVAQMQRLSFLLEERRRCAAFYAEALKNISWLRLPSPPAHVVHAWQSYATLYAPEEPTLRNVERLHRGRNNLMQFLEQLGISTRQGTHAPPHLEYYANKYEIRPEQFPNAYLADRLSLALPLYPGMTDDELEYVTRSLEQYQPE